MADSLNTPVAAAQSASISDLKPVDNPDKAFADITRKEYLDYVNNYQGFELDLIDRSQNDRSLIDAAKKDSLLAGAVTQGVVDRNMERYGGGLTAAQGKQQGRLLGTGTALGQVQSVNDARIAQKELNTSMLTNLINIGQGVNSTAQSQLGASAANYSQMQSAYKSAQAASKANNINTMATLGTLALMMM